jgi:hypothetical protein
MTGELDPRVSDEATGLPPLEELGDDETLVVLAWSSGEGLASNPLAGDVPVAVRYLHLRGVANSDLAAGVVAEWAQLHIAVPVEVALDVAADLARGSTFEAEVAYTRGTDLVERAVAAVNAMRALLEELGVSPERDPNLSRLEQTILNRLAELGR